MATIRFHDKTQKKISNEYALEVWRIMQGQQEPNESQEKEVAQIRRLYMDWHTAPDDYLMKYADTISDLVSNCWIVNHQGILVRPEPRDRNCLRISRLLGLWQGSWSTGSKPLAQRELL